MRCRSRAEKPEIKAPDQLFCGRGFFLSGFWTLPDKSIGSFARHPIPPDPRARRNCVMLYRLNPSHTTAIPSIAGKSLAHRRLSPSQAAAVAAQLVLGERSIEPTFEQAAAIVGACTANARRAARLTPALREQYAADGDRKSLPRPPAAPKPKPDLTSAWNAASPAERVAFGRTVGIDRVWSREVAR